MKEASMSSHTGKKALRNEGFPLVLLWEEMEKLCFSMGFAREASFYSGVHYLIGSCECISMGRGVPPGPPRVRASMKPRTTAHLRAVPNSSRVYLSRQGRQRANVQHPDLVWKDGGHSVFSARLRVGGQSLTCDNNAQGSFSKSKGFEVVLITWQWWTMWQTKQ